MDTLIDKIKNNTYNSNTLTITFRNNVNIKNYVML